MNAIRLVGAVAVVGMAAVFGSPAAMAQPEASSHALTGTWKVSDTPAALRKELDTAIDRTASEFNLLIREIARVKLQGATKVCQSYLLDVQPSQVAFACDGKAPVSLARDGSPFHTKNDDGEDIQGTVSVKGDTVVVTWQGPSGKRVNTFSPTSAGLDLRAEVSSPHMPTPLRWTVHYAR